MVNRYKCDLCNKKIIDNDFFRITHILFETFVMLLFLIKLFVWMFLQSFKSGSIKNFPCKCGHKAFWHLTMFENVQLPRKKPVSWLRLLFFYKFKIDKNYGLMTCFLCNFGFSPSPEPNRCWEFDPLNNLIYLEKLYNKKK